MANTLLTNGEITREGLRVLKNNTKFAKQVNREYDDRFGVDGAKIGNVLNIRRPPRYMTAVGQALQLEDATETSVPLILNTQRHLGIAFSSQDRTLNIDDFSKRFVRPGMATLANFIDFDGLGLYSSVFNEVGTPGTVPATRSVYLAAGQRLTEYSVPFDDRCNMLSPGMNATFTDLMAGLFNPQQTVSSIIKNGMVAKDTLGFDHYVDQNVRTQVVGPLGGAPLVNGAGQTGSSIITNGWTAVAAKRLSQNDIISFAGVFAVNPQNRQSTGALAQWVVVSDVSSDAGGNATIPISGPSGNGIITAGPFQNCTGSPANAAAITVQGAANTSSPRGLAFHPDAFCLGMADLVIPGGVDFAERESIDGFSLRLVRAYDINSDRFPFRADVLYGWVPLYPELACRIAS